MENITESLYHGCKRIEGTLHGRYTTVVYPAHPAPGNPWVWRAEYFDAFPAVDIALLQRGWHICYHAMGDALFDAVTPGLDQFYTYAVGELGLSPLPVMFGFSRGGLYAYDYALNHPDHLCAVYFDCAVLDVKALPLWPGGIGEQFNAPDDEEWLRRRTCYGLISDEEARNFAKNPADTFDKFVSYGLPTLMLAGGRDTTTPVIYNAARLARIIPADKLLYIVKPDCGHHPHSAITDGQLAEAVGFLLAAWNGRK